MGPAINSGGIEERGGELKASELVPRTVYVLEKADRPMVTMWFKRMYPASRPEESHTAVAEFWAGATRITLWLFVTPEDTLRDDSGVQIRVYQFLGKV